MSVDVDGQELLGSGPLDYGRLMYFGRHEACVYLVRVTQCCCSRVFGKYETYKRR